MIKPRNFLCLVLLLLMQGQMAQGNPLSRPQKIGSSKTPTTLASSLDAHNQVPRVTSYAVRYERYGVLGLYHVSLIVDVISDGVRLQRLHIDGAGRIPKYEFNIGFSRPKFGLPPAFLAGYVNPKGYKQHFLGLFTSNEFGPTYTLNDEQGTKFLAMAHHAMTIMNNSDKQLYFTIPFQIGSVQYWTSNSVVASLIKVANEEGINLPDPVGGSYPGFSGPFLPKSLFVSSHDHEEANLSFPMLGVIFFWGVVMVLFAAVIKATVFMLSRLRRKRTVPDHPKGDPHC